jgi:hypothetical protein
MLPLIFIEDIFTQFVDTVSSRILQQDLAASHSFYSTIHSGGALTQSQGNLLVKILHKYKIQSINAGFDYTEFLIDPKWKHPFRVIDLSRRVWVETENNTVWVCLKFPYQMKKEFETEFGDFKGAVWDPERKLRKVELYQSNLVRIYEFAKENSFEIDDTLMIALADVEEIWERQDAIIPHSSIVGDFVLLHNYSEDVQEWWYKHWTQNVNSDLLLAKSMGYPYSGKPTTMIEKIAASESNAFWIKTPDQFLELCESIDGKVCIILDRVADLLAWLKDFARAVDQSGFDRNLIKVCFRADKSQNQELNTWIKENDFGGKVEGGKILIFNHKPAKWLFKDVEDVKLLVSNNLYPATSVLTKDWFNTHPCTIYLGDIKPSHSKDKRIVEL